MANTGKYVSSADDIKEHAAKLAALFEIKPSVKPHYLFEVGDAAALLKVDEKTLQRKRNQRDALIKAGEEPDPIDIASIPYVRPNPNVKYTAQELEDYLKRVSESSGSRMNMARGPTSLSRAERAPPGRAAAVAVLGFQSWLANATPMATWPFSIQSDGRPMDICAAILTGRLTGVAERLTIREFGERAADAAAKAFHDAERLELEIIMPAGRNGRKTLARGLS